MEVVLHVGDAVFLLNWEEAMKVAEVLCAAQTFGTQWKDGGNRKVLMPPNTQSATIAPYTAYLRLQIEGSST
jgi:hypothetical protein